MGLVSPELKTFLTEEVLPVYAQYPSNLWFFEDAGTAVQGMTGLIKNIQQAAAPTREMSETVGTQKCYIFIYLYTYPFVC